MSDDGGMPRDASMKDIRYAVETSIAAQTYSNDTMCCGVAGQIDFLLDAATVVSEDRLLTAASSRLAAIQARWVETGDIGWDRGSKNFNLGLFRGVAGVGYVALRTVNRALPRVLIWD